MLAFQIESRLTNLNSPLRSHILGAPVMSHERLARTCQVFNATSTVQQ